MSYWHYAAELPERIESIGQRVEMKPCGLWFSPEGPGGWAAWCEGERFRLDALARRARVRLAPSARILTLGTPGDLLSFTDAFATIPPELKGAPPALLRGLWIDWPEVALQWDGVILDPYFYAMRLEPGLLWYHTVDCACGCVWRASAIEAFEPDDAIYDARGRLGA